MWVVTSQLDCGNALLVGLPKKSLASLQRVQNAAARVIVVIKKLDPIKPYLKALHWLPIEKQIEFKIAVLTYRCLNCHAPSIFKTYWCSTGRTLIFVFDHSQPPREFNGLLAIHFMG